MKNLIGSFVLLGFILLSLGKPSFLPRYPREFIGDHINKLRPDDNFTFNTSILLDGFTNSNQQTYVGYIPVREDQGGRLFYFYHSPVNQTVNDSAPLILWLQGGPGCSSLIGAMWEMGPVILDSFDNTTGEATYSYRNTTWSQGNHMLFIDSPIGSGLSIMSDQDYTSSATQAAADVHEFLLQFFDIYPSLKSNPFYITGESYAGHYVPALAYLIMQNQAQTGINLAGIAIGNGWVDPINQLPAYSYFTYALGLMSDQGVQILKSMESQAVIAILNGQLELSGNLFDDMLAYVSAQNPGIHIDEFREYGPGAADLVTPWANHPKIKAWLNIPPDHVYSICNSAVNANYSQDFQVSYAHFVGSLLGRIKILIYSGADDILVNTIGTNNWIMNLAFPDELDIRQVRKQIWTSSGNVVGTFSKRGNFVYAIVNKAGHAAPREQGQSTYEMMQHFINDDDIWQ